MKSSIIRIENLHKHYDSLEVLRGISLTIDEGEVVAIVGPSGAGKTTLLHAIGTLSSFDEGKVWVDGVDVGTLTSDTAADFRCSHIGLVFQFHHLLPEFTALENVCLPGYIASHDKSTVEQRAKELLTLMGLKERMTHKPAELSGGEQQRVAIARALINSPRLLLADEPSGNLDSHNRTEIHKLFFELRDKFGITVVVVTHDESLAKMSDRKIVIVDGQIQNDTTEE